MRNLRICFAGTPAFSAAHLSALLASPHELIAVYTQPDRRSGRGKKLQPSPVKQIALQHSIPVHQPASLRSEEQENILAQMDLDVLVVVAYGLILPQAILDLPKFGCINVHASLLPRWRGAAPIERALLAGDKVTGVTIMHMDEGLDTGDMLLKETVVIEHSDTRVDLEDKLREAGKNAIVYALDNLEELTKNAAAQDNSETTYAAKLEKSEALIDWRSNAEQIDRQVRVGIGRSPAFTFLREQRLRILHTVPVTQDKGMPPGTIIGASKDSFTVACLDSSIRVERIQLPSKNSMSVRDVMNSRPTMFRPGLCFSSTISRSDPDGE